ncbi:MAG: hypothetical protein K8R74_11970 [Bacteroidales bacterium]|nr:hypothetical protein [Bacteroidales bacterium]
MKKGIMLSCEDATHLVVKKAYEKLSLWDRMRIFMHLSMCKYCSLFEKQNKFLDDQVAKLDEASQSKLDQDTKTKILEDIQK